MAPSQVCFANQKSQETGISDEKIKLRLFIFGFQYQLDYGGKKEVMTVTLGSNSNNRQQKKVHNVSKKKIEKN